MKLDYRRRDEYRSVNLARLRPGNSYGQLIGHRTHAIDDLIARFGQIPPELLVRRDCPTCGGQSHKRELRKDHLEIVRCKRCDLVFVNPVFDEEHYKRIYKSLEYQAIVKDLGEASHDYRVERFGQERVDIMSRFLDGTAAPRYLDVGCSTGFVVEAAQRRGWRASGIDLNPSAIAFGSQRGLNVAAMALEEVAIEPGTLDAISLFDVLEHLIDPRKTLERAHSLLKTGGIAFIYVPNFDSAARYLMGGDAHFIWPTHHLNYYNCGTISDLLGRCGFSTEWLATEGLDIADFLWWKKEIGHRQDTALLEEIADDLQFFINAGGYGKNLRVIARKA